MTVETAHSGDGPDQAWLTVVTWWRKHGIVAPDEATAGGDADCNEVSQLRTPRGWPADAV